MGCEVGAGRRRGQKQNKRLYFKRQKSEILLHREKHRSKFEMGAAFLEVGGIKALLEYTRAVPRGR